MQELTTNELRQTTGGGIFGFIAGAIVAGFAWGVANFIKDVLVNGENFDMSEW